MARLTQYRVENGVCSLREQTGTCFFFSQEFVYEQRS
jgi:hypothetical protein